MVFGLAPSMLGGLAGIPAPPSLVAIGGHDPAARSISNTLPCMLICMLICSDLQPSAFLLTLVPFADALGASLYPLEEAAH